jgi:hypothetical protein
MSPTGDILRLAPPLHLSPRGDTLPSAVGQMLLNLLRRDALSLIHNRLHDPSPVGRFRLAQFPGRSLVGGVLQL